MTWQSSSHSAEPRASPVSSLPVRANDAASAGSVPPPPRPGRQHLSPHHQHEMAPYSVYRASPPAPAAGGFGPQGRRPGPPTHHADPRAAAAAQGYYDYHNQHHHHHHHITVRGTYPPRPAAPHHLYGMSPPPFGGVLSTTEPRASPSREVSLLSSPPSVDVMKTGGCTCKKSRCLKLYCQCFALSTTCGPKCKCQTCHNTTLHAEDIDHARKTILERNPSAFDDKFRGGNGAAGSSSPQILSPYRPPIYATPPPPPPPHPPSAYYSMTASSSQSSSSSPPAVVIVPPSASSASSTIATIPTTPGVPAPSGRVNKFGCKCRRSFCLKKYCDCYQNSAACGSSCRCTNCKNRSVDVHENNNKDNHDNYRSSSDALTTPSPATVPVVPKSHGTYQGHHTESSPGVVSVEETREARSPPTTKNEHDHHDDDEKESEDRMAIMAAVAMTELLGGSSNTASRSVSGADDNTTTAATTVRSPDWQGKRQLAAEEVGSTTSETTAQELSPSPKRARLQREVTQDGESSSSREQPQQHHHHLRMGESPVKLQQQHQYQQPPDESRNPSPVSVTTTPQQHFPRTTYRPPPPYPYPLPSRHHHHHHHHHPPPPPLTRMLHHHPHHPPASYYYSSPPSMAPPPPPSTPKGAGVIISNAARGSPTYEDVIKSSGLPKALSFRKICSKCGKTRGEHGELGFGNKCVYQDCGKCGAGVQMHLKAGTPMGILCRLTVEEGATPGAAATYDRKIRDLAARAELQKTLMEDKRERVERLAQAMVASTN